MNSTLKTSDYKQSSRSKKLKKCRHCCKKFVAFLFSHVGLCCLVVAYSIMGGFVFMRLEGPHEKDETLNVLSKRKNHVDRLWKLTIEYNVLYKENWTSAVDVVLRDFQLEVAKLAKEKGWSGSDTKKDKQWSFAGALLYSVTVITTIGYGHIAPKTPEGRVTTIFYALVGIPLTLLCLTNIGGLMADIFRFLYKNVCCGLCCIICNGERPKFAKPKSKRKNTRKVIRQKEESVRNKGGSKKSREKEKNKTKFGFKLSFSNRNGKPSSTMPPEVEETLPTTVFSGPPTYTSAITLPDSPPAEHDMDQINSIEGKLDERLPALDTQPLNNKHTVTVIEDDESEGDYIDDEEDEEVEVVETDPDEKVTVPISLCVLLMAGYIFGGAVLFSLWEQWNYLEGSYFCFITLSTIGFGDFVPGASVDSWSSQEKQVLCTMYLLFGLAFIAMCFELMQEEVRAKFRWLGRKVGLFSNKVKKSRNTKSVKKRKKANDLT